jgi:hypothetical protein
VQRTGCYDPSMARLRRSPTVVLLVGALAAFHLGASSNRLPHAAERAIEAVTRAELRTLVETLASDEMAGRGLGQPGNERAERYIADAFVRFGVPPAAEGAHRQPVGLYRPKLGKGGRLDVTLGDRVIAALPVGPEFYPLPESMPETVTGPALFLGHGVSVATLGHDDYSGVDARGAIVFALEGAPAALAAPENGGTNEARDLGTLSRKIADAAAHGAAAVVIVQATLPDYRGPWVETGEGPDASYRIYPRVAGRDRGPSDETRRSQPALAVAAILEQAAAPVREALRGNGAVRATLTPGVVVDPMTVHNVIGMIEGGDRPHREMVVVGAHLDHDGVDGSGTIYNGADDNASGTAAVLAMAAAFARAASHGERPDRTVLFALWNGEEQGSLGAEAFVRNPRPDLTIAANINLDMVGRDEEADPGDPRFYGFPRRTTKDSDNLLHVLGYTKSPNLAGLARTANQHVGLDLRLEYDRDAQNLLQRSDHWVFLRRGIPAIFLTTGLHPDYHRPSDDAHLIDYAKLEKITELAARAAWLAADVDR